MLVDVHAPARYLRSHHLTEAWWAAVWVAGLSAKEHGMTARGMIKIHQTRKTGAAWPRTSELHGPFNSAKNKLLPIILHVQCCVPLVFSRLPKAFKKTKPAASFIGDLHQCQRKLDGTGSAIHTWLGG